MRLRLTLAYDGSAFSGWQSQARGTTVQDLIEGTIKKIAGVPLRIHGAGRTDAGVHALGQVAHFDAPDSTRLSPAAWMRALNGNLPPQIRVLRASEVNTAFHARFSATGKIYRYTIHTGPVLPPHLFQRTWHVPQPLDTGLLKETALIFSGRHDFRAFAANRGSPTEDTVRTIRSVRMTKAGPLISLTFEGDGFLYKMVRMLAGASVRVALGRRSLASVRELLDQASSAKWTHVAPADGLFLVRVLY